MTCSRLFILGALVGGGALVSAMPVVYAQPAAPAAPAAAGKAPGKTAAKAPAKGPAPAKPAAGAPAAAPAAPAKYPFGLPEARVHGVQNQVEIAAATEKRSAKKDDVVQPGQRIDTGNAATADLTFADGTRFQVAENSAFSVYGVAPVAPAGKKAKPFKPGSNTLSKGEVFVVVPPPPPPATPAAPPVVAKGKKPAKVVAPKLAVSAVIVTPVGKVRVMPGAKARITVNPAGVTFVSVYEGTSELQGQKGKPIVLAAGTGSRVQDVKTPPAAPAPLPATPATTGVQSLVFSTGAPVEVRGSYGAAAGAPAPAQWHVQVAQDEQFDKVVRESRVPATDTRLLATPLPPGEYVARVSALNAEGAEGAMSPVVRVKVAKVVLWPGSEGKRAAVQVEGRGLYCGLDGADLSPMTTPLPLSPAQDHTLRCATVQAGAKPDETAEFKIAAAQSGPLVSKFESGPATWSETEGLRPVRLILSDASGNPISGAKVEIEGAGGARAEGTHEVGTTGTYESAIHWPKGQTGLSLNYKINATETYAAALPDEQPPAATKPKEPERPASKRFAFEMSLMPLVNVDIPRGVLAVGGGIELGGRIRLPYGGIGIHLRPQYEYYSPNPAFAHVVAVGLPITYRIRKDVDADWVPYIGVLPQFLADFEALARDGKQIEAGVWKTQFAIGGLIGSELRLRRGAVFIEGGYRYVIGRVDQPDYPTLSGVFANLGYRLNF